jgi:hypothetical protein
LSLTQKGLIAPIAIPRWVHKIRVSFFRHARDIRYEISLKVRVLSEHFVPMKWQCGYRYSQGDPSNPTRSAHINLRANLVR